VTGDGSLTRLLVRGKIWACIKSKGGDILPRTARTASKSGVYHIMFRGNELRDIFIDDEDKSRFLQTLSDKSKDENFIIYAYCLMDNHVHLLIAGEHERLGNLVKRINTSYVYYFNKKYGRIGHLFHDRYKSEPVETDAYLLEAVRYIHSNPIKAGISDSLNNYQWSSYHYYIDECKNSTSIIESDNILSMFSKNRENAVKLFKDYSKKQIDVHFNDIIENANEAGKVLKSENEAIEFVNGFLKKKCIKLVDLKLKAYKGVRNELVQELKQKSSLSFRQIAMILGINRGVVQRT
jgi:putative transposase